MGQQRQGIVRRLIVRTIATIWLGLAAGVLAASPASAQAPNNPAPAPPMPSQIEEHGVDLVSGELVMGGADVAIGPSDHHGLRFSRQWSKNAWRIAELPTISGSSANPIVSFEGRSVPFETVGGNLKPVFEDGSTLSVSGGVYTFVGSDGTQITFTPTTYRDYTLDAGLGIGTQVVFPDGTVRTYHYETQSAYLGPEVPEGCYSNPPPEMIGYCYALMNSWGTYYVRRLSSITTSTGFQIKLSYATNSLTFGAMEAWWYVTNATALNNAVEYCNPTASSCTFANTWPEATYSNWLNGQIAAVTGPGGGTTNYTYASGELTGIQPPGAGSNLVTYGYSGGKVASVSHGGGTWSYSYGTNTTTVTDPLTNTLTLNFNSAGQTTSSVAGGLTTYFAYCGASESNCPEGLLKTVTLPETNYVQYAYDARGNTTSVTRVAKSGSGLSNIVTSAAYPGSCSNPKTCNQPTSTTDARGQVTDYTYDAGHGGLLTATLPADGAGVRPQTRITYASVNARYLTAASTWSNGAAISVPTAISSCRTASSGNPAACAGTAEERVTTLAYPSGVPSNAQPSSVTTKAGNNTLVATTTVAYDDYGRPTTVDGPQSGTADATLAAYNLANQPLWRIGPDPDGADTALFPAVKYTYRSDGQLDYVQAGTVTAQSSAGMAGSFSELQRTTIAYDGYHRPSRQTVSSGGTAYQVSDQVYDAAGRVLCSVLRMDGLASPGSLLTGCSPPQTGGANGPDRVSYNHYDALGRVWKVTSAYGVSGQAADEAIATFSDNGRLATLTDAESNRTTYEYDGHDRLVKTRFPHPSTKNTSSTTDYEEVGYDANGNVTSFRTRAAETLTMTYDNLSRLTVKVVPDRSGLDATHERDVYFGYDLFGNMAFARFDSTSGEGITNYYNTLGQLTAAEALMDAVTRPLYYHYDVAGNQTRLTWPDSNYVNYYRHAASGGLYYADLNSSSPLFYTPRDTAGRPGAIYRWATSAGTWWNMGTGYGYDPVSRPTGFGHYFPSSAYNVSSNFLYNPAGQITRRETGPDLYAWPGAAAVDRAYTANGLNQYAAVTPAGGSAVNYSYDANGNLTGDGTQTFTYDIENRLVARSGGGTAAALRYDPLGRLYEVYYDDGDPLTVNPTTRFLHDGSDLVAEYDIGGTLLRRYVHGGGGGDDPLVWFEGSGVTDGARRYLYADERGSIIAVSDSNGASVTVNSYDEYGIPAAGNAGRFGYTGQAWLPELGMNYYKARMYSPTLGRFMQTDPIGYGDGMNMYAYVGGDPVNGVDPTGMWRQCTADELWQRRQGITGNAPTGNSITVNLCPGEADGDSYDCSFGACNNWLNPPQRREESDAPASPQPDYRPQPLPPCGEACDGKPLPRCMRNFLKRYYPNSDVGAVRLFNGTYPGFGNNSVTFGNNIHLANSNFYRNPVGNESAIRHIFHEYTHTRQYAAGTLSVSGYILDAVRYGDHDSIPVEAEAIANATVLTDAFLNSPEANQC